MTMTESPIFVRTYDFIQWLVPRTMSFPRSQRFILTKRLQDSVLDFYEAIIEAALCSDRQRRSRLHAADVELVKVRKYLRLARDMKWLKPGQYRYAASQVTEIGNLLGGWIGGKTNPTSRQK
jgi:four helix bundle protein